LAELAFYRVTGRRADLWVARRRHGGAPADQAGLSVVGYLRDADTWDGDLRKDMGSGDGVFGVAGGAFLERG
jgi:hypothetical protein